jgi:AbrB family looped-hinge helix DNA binding protein
MKVSGMDSRMATRITIKGQVTIPKSVRDALRLSPGDRVEFARNGTGEFVLHKALSLIPAPVPPPQPHPERTVPARAEEQTRRRAAELLELLRGLD